MTDRLPKQFEFQGGFIFFKREGKTVNYSIYRVIVDEKKPILQEQGEYTGQDPKELAKPYLGSIYDMQGKKSCLNEDVYADPHIAMLKKKGYLK